MKFNSPRDSADRHGNATSRMPVQKVDDTQYIQEHLLNGFAGEQMDTIEHFHQYGFTNVVQPATGQGDQQQSAEGMTLFLGSNRTHGVNIASGDRRYRLYKLAPGEVALHDDQGHQVHIRRDGLWVSAPNSKKVMVQIMDDNTLPQDSGSGDGGDSGGGGGNNTTQKNGQVQQAGRPAQINLTIDNSQFTLNHPNGAVTFNCASFTVNASGTAKIIAGANMLIRGLNTIMYATASNFIRALGSNNAKAPANLATPAPWAPPAQDPPITS